jgi:hypothetical protein
VRTALIQINDVDTFAGAAELAILAQRAHRIATGCWAWPRRIAGGMAERVARTPVLPLPVPTLDGVHRDPTILAGLPLAVLVELERQAAHVGVDVRAVIARHLARTHEAPNPSCEDDLLSLEDAARRLGVAVPWLRRRAKTLPFTRKLSHKIVRFSARGLDRWQATRRPTMD